MPDNSFPIVTEEVEALMTYCAEKGLAEDKDILLNLGQDLYRFKEITTEGKRELAAKILQNYAQLAKLTQPVNGRTLLNTRKINFFLAGLLIYTCAFFAFSVGSQILQLWVGDWVTPEEGLRLWLFNFNVYGLAYLTPFFWGGLGSCVYLLKKLSDYAADQTFDNHQLHGWATRVWLGAILGGVLQFIFNTETIAGALQTNALAFLTGVSVKVVYGGIEKSISEISNRFNLDSVRSKSDQTQAVRNYLSKQLAELKDEGDSEKRTWLTQLLENLGGKKNG